jgi:hypothetical protein
MASKSEVGWDVFNILLFGFLPSFLLVCISCLLAFSTLHIILLLCTCIEQFKILNKVGSKYIDALSHRTKNCYYTTVVPQKENQATVPSVEPRSTAVAFTFYHGNIWYWKDSPHFSYVKCFQKMTKWVSL